MFEIHGWGLLVYWGALACAFGCGYAYRKWEERRRLEREIAENAARVTWNPPAGYVRFRQPPRYGIETETHAQVTQK